MSTLLLIAALALVSIWTARLARAKGRNPWLWGGASFVLVILPTVNLFAVVPLIILMFLKNPQQESGPIVETTTCPKCQSASVKNSRFCTRCGWELSRVNTLDAPKEVKEPVVVQSTQTQEPAAEPSPQPPETAEAPEPDTVAQPAEVATEFRSEPLTEPAAAESEAVASDGEPATAENVDETPADAETETPAEVTSYRKPVPVDAPTAAAMTERGVRLFNQGRTQEAIDQFTKAIALDANYIEAWAKRAEAYARLGRGDQAAEDQRRLDSLNASST